MNEKHLFRLKYPIGTFTAPATITIEHIQNWISIIQIFPSSLKTLTTGLSVEDKNRTYRTGGWTVKQIVHHCADSHMNSWIRFKWTLTEDRPEIKAYREARWAELADSLDEDLEDSIGLLTGLHSKWAKLLKRLTNEDLKREFIHPESRRLFNLEETIGLYAWHCEHHLAHIRIALQSV